VKEEAMQIGDQVQLSDGTKGKILIVHPGGSSVYLELEDTRCVTVFAKDVTVLPPAPVEAVSPALEANLEKLGEAHEGNVVDIPKVD
jgi:hypothetical protein